MRERLRGLEDARRSGDIRSIMHLIRTALSRDLGGMGNVDLYRHSYAGTKTLIEHYVEAAVDTIEAVVNHSSSGRGVSSSNRGYSLAQQYRASSSSTNSPIPTTTSSSSSSTSPPTSHRDLLDGMLFSRQSFGRSALLLSGGGTFGMSHVGVLKALFEADLLPRIISGASAGSIVCAVMCTSTDEEMPALLQRFPYGDLSVFEEGGSSDGGGVLAHLRRLLTEGSWSDISNLTRVMRDLTGDLTFQEAYNRTRRILNICVSTASVYEMPRLLNYVTAPNVMIWSAVAASCSVPLVFNASPLLVKDPVTGQHHPWNPAAQHFIDGSVDNDLPMTRLAEMFNVNHFIVSQVNPHVVPFLTRDDHLSPDQKMQRVKLGQRDERDWVYTLTALARDEALHRLQFMSEMGILPNLATKCRSILSQKYSGDITILPEISMQDLPRLLKNPTPEFMLRSCLQGERATWPKISRIRDRCAIELALDRAVHQLRARVVFSESQSDLLKLNMSTSNLRNNLPSSHGHSQSTTGTFGGPVGGQRRHRRRSGGSIQTLPDSKRMLEFDSMDVDTSGEDRPELQSRALTSSQLALRKPRLKRSNNSQAFVPQYKVTVSEVPAWKRRHPGNEETRQADSDWEAREPDTSRDASGHSASDPWSDMAEPSRGALTSPTDDVETSEPGHWSDADEEQGTEDSDLDPYSDGHKASSSPKAAGTVKEDTMFGPEGRIGAGWD